jgi:hypothetical protein
MRKIAVLDAPSNLGLRPPAVGIVLQTRWRASMHVTRACSHRRASRQGHWRLHRVGIRQLSKLEWVGVQCTSAWTACHRIANAKTHPRFHSLRIA